MSLTSAPALVLGLLVAFATATAIRWLYAGGSPGARIGIAAGVLVVLGVAVAIVYEAR